MFATVSASLALLASYAPQQVELHPEGPVPIYGLDEGFGTGIVLDGPIAAVSSPDDRKFLGNGVYGKGSVNIYAFDGVDWTEAVELSGDSIYTGFGAGLALQGDVLVIGSSGSGIYPMGNPERPYIVVYRLIAGVWIEEARLETAIADPDQNFGRSIGIDGDTIVVGGIGDDGAGGLVEGAYVFERIAGVWSQVDFLSAGPYQLLGSSVAIEGDLIAMGAPFFENKITIFERGAGGTWSLDEVVDEPYPSSGTSASFGQFMQFHAGDLYVASGFSQSRLWIYERSGSGWTIGQEFTEVSHNFSVEGSRLVLERSPSPSQVDSYERVAGTWQLEGAVDVPPFLEPGGAPTYGGLTLSGDRLLFGRPVEDSFGPDSGGAHIAAFDGTDWVHEASLVPAVGDSLSRQYGDVVAVDGDHLLASAADAYGMVHAYERGPTGWDLLERFDLSADLRNGSFGRSLEVRGDHLWVGDPSGSTMAAPGFPAGRVLAYEFDGTGWVGPHQILRNLSATTGLPLVGHPDFGASVAASDDWVVIGSPGQETPIGAPKGYAFVFARSSSHSSIVYNTFLGANNGSGTMRFGGAVDASGDTIVVASTNRSRVDVFEWSAGTWTRMQVITESGTGLGRALALEGDRLALGAPNAGEVQIFERTGPGAPFELESVVVPAGAPVPTPFGASVSLQGDTLVVGAPDPRYHAENAGSAFVFRFTDNRWVESDRVVNTGGLPGDGFGHSTALSGTTAVVAAPYRKSPDGIVAQGIVFVDELVADRFTFCPCDGGSPCGNEGLGSGCTNSSGAGASISASGSTSIAVDDQTITVSGLPTNVSGLIYRGRRATGRIPFGDGLRCVSGQSRRGPVRNTGMGGTLTLGPGYVTAENSVAPASVHILAGATWYYQGYFRDSAGPCSSAVSMSNALAVTYAP